MRQLTAKSLLFNCTVIFLRVTFQSHDFSVITFESGFLVSIISGACMHVPSIFVLLQLYSKKTQSPNLQ